MSVVQSNRWSGLAYPWGPEVKTFVTVKDDGDILKSSVINILCTSPGERVMLPEFGAGILARLFEPMDDALLTQIKTFAADALARWDDRIRLYDLTVAQDFDLGTVNCRVVFQDATAPFAQAEQQVAEFTVTVTS